MPAQFQGTSSFGSTVAEVEATRALRATLRAIDIGALGSFSAGSSSGVMAAGLASNSPIFSFRGPASGLALIKRVRFGAIGLGTAFAAGSGLFNLFAARGFSGSDTGGGALTITNNSTKRRTSFASSGVQDIRCSATATLSAGTRTKDAAPLAALMGICSATASTVILPNQNILETLMGEWPLVLAANEGFVLEATVAATGTWSFHVNVDWDEVAAY
jgi:hypothetical protein